MDANDEVISALLRAIGDFLSDAEKCVSYFEDQYGRRDVLQAWRDKVIPQQGKLLGKYNYRMHGIGCWMRLTTHEVDFDFVSDGTVGFDAWRIGLYVEQLPDTYPPLATMDEVRASFPKLLEQQLVEPFDRLANSYRLRR